jgi:arabinofuranosyltransferase
MKKIKIRNTLNIYFLILVIISVLFLGWCLRSIYFNSFIAVDGRRYYSLFDDAMISMRYAWNLAQGNGLVWNIGERVEGISNTLMTLLMALIMWILKNKTWSVLAIQLIGIPTIFGIAWITYKIQQLIFGQTRFTLLNLLCYLSLILYFPLVFWTVSGMETGLLTLLISASAYFAILWTRTQKPVHALWMVIFSSLAFLTRNESLIYFGLIIIYIFAHSIRQKTFNKNKWIFIGILAFYISVIIGMEIFRLSYYGEFWPNTYILKMTGVPLYMRIHDGFTFIFVFFKENIILVFWLIIFFLTVKKISIEHVLLLGFLLIATLYHLWIGGDSFGYWRLFCPAIPFTMILAIQGISQSSITLSEKVSKYFTLINKKSMTIYMILIFFLISIISLDSYYYKFISFKNVYYPTAKEFVNDALAMNKIANDKASVGVIYAGTLPYYTDLRAIDFLGKSDKYIARLPPSIRTPEELKVNLRYTAPGHNKFDLNYSILTLQPTFIADYYLGKYNLFEWAKTHYVTAALYYRAGDEKSLVLLKLLKDSPNIDWGQVYIQELR